jgi:hypothetical protein
MDEFQDLPILDNITNIDVARIKRLKIKGHYWSLYDEFEKLRLKFFYEKTLTPQEAVRFITLLKYHKENGHSEAFKLNCEYLYKQYCEKYDL